MNDRFPRNPLCQQVLPMHHLRIIRLVDGKFLVIEFHLAQVDDIVFPIDKQVDLCAFGFVFSAKIQKLSFTEK